MHPEHFQQQIIKAYLSKKYMTLWPSYHQGLILTSKIQPSGFTYETQVPNQEGLHILTQLPNQVGLQIEQVLTWLNITIYIIGLNMTFSSNYKYDFCNKYQKYLKRDHISEPP